MRLPWYERPSWVRHINTLPVTAHHDRVQLDDREVWAWFEQAGWMQNEQGPDALCLCATLRRHRHRHGIGCVRCNCLYWPARRRFPWALLLVQAAAFISLAMIGGWS